MELEKLGETYFNDTAYFRVPGSDFCYDVPQETVKVGEDVVFENTMLGVTPVCQFDEDNAEASAYKLLYSFSFPADFDTGFGPTLTVIYIIALAIYFATSSDSGSLVVDHLASNGRRKHHWIQRAFWATTEGAVATALLSAGGSAALSAVQAGSVISGLPFVVMLCYLMQSIWVMCEQGAASDTADFEIPMSAEFSMPIYGGVFNLFEYAFSLGDVNPKRVERQMHLPSGVQAWEFAKGIFVPFYSLHQVLSGTYPRNRLQNMLCVGGYTICYLGWISIFISLTASRGLIGWAWSLFFIDAILLSVIRNGFRSRHNFRSNAVGDVISSLFFWPQVLTQMRLECMNLGLDEVDEYDA